MMIKDIYKNVIDDCRITLEDALRLVDAPLDKLCDYANKIRQYFCQDKFDAYTIINVKSGNCSQDCKYCAQSIYYDTGIDKYPLLSADQLEEKTLAIYNQGLKRISYVASGPKLTDEELKRLYDVISKLKSEYPDMKICISAGLMDNQQIKWLSSAGITRLHNNLETSRNYFPNICTTHTYQDKLDTINMINNQSVKICSGAIFGLGESFKDRIDLAFELKRLNVHSIPINILHPIKNTPLENNEILSNDEVCRIVAIYRFINPQAYIRLAGGRLQLSDCGRKAFCSGVNAAILGNMLTTDGVTLDEDLKMINELGYQIVYNDEI